jgi:hypothetical protein
MSLQSFSTLVFFTKPKYSQTLEQGQTIEKPFPYPLVIQKSHFVELSFFKTWHYINMTFYQFGILSIDCWSTYQFEFILLCQAVFCLLGYSLNLHFVKISYFHFFNNLFGHISSPLFYFMFLLGLLTKGR